MSSSTDRSTSTNGSGGNKRQSNFSNDNFSKRPKNDGGNFFNRNFDKDRKNHHDDRKKPTPTFQSQTRKEKWQERDGKFHYGNYNRYYGKRTNEAQSNIDVQSPDFNDPRLKLFQRQWFEKKKVLDIGCNVGLVTMAVAHQFRPSTIVGLDIDGELIHSAKNILRKKFGPPEAAMETTTMVKKDESSKPSIAQSAAARSSIAGTSAAARASKRDDGDDEFTQKEKAAIYERVQFESGNYVLADDSLLDFVQPEYDVVLALSVTKWIHLNWGDDGMKRFFRRIYRHLNPGGVLILEPQPWSTYKKKRALTPEIAEHFNKIQFKPDSFRSFLTSPEVGFESCELINKVEQEKAKGFSRPIFLFRKPLVEPDRSEATTTAALIGNEKNGGESSTNGDNGDQHRNGGDGNNGEGEPPKGEPAEEILDETPTVVKEEESENGISDDK